MKISNVEATATDIGHIQAKDNETVPFDDENKSTMEYSKKMPDFTELSEDDINFLKSIDLPKTEYSVDQEKISDLEKFVHFEFFEGRPTKTPMRYLKVSICDCKYY